MKALPVALAATTCALAGVVLAQQPSAPHAGHGAPAASQGGSTGAPPRSPATEAYEAAAARMHRDMAIAYSGDADADFLRAMIPHHRAAIEMARVVLRHGKDAEVRKLAGEIVAAQESEIAAMEGHLRRLGR